MRAKRKTLADKALQLQQQLIWVPALMRRAVEAEANGAGISVSEWWRRAARLRLGWREVLKTEEGPTASPPPQR